MAKTPDQLEREAQQRNPAKYNERNPWPRVDQFVRDRTPVDLQPSEDFSAIRAARTVTASRLDATDTIRELRAKQRRVDEQRDEQIANQNDPLSPEFYTPGGTPENEFLTTQYGERALLLEQRELERALNRDISGYQSTRDIILRAREAGVELTADDINNMVEWTTLNSAADKVIALHKNGDVIGMRNVSLTLAGLSPEMAALLPDVVEEKIVESIEDPNLIAQFSAQIMRALEVAMAPFIAANEWVMEGTRAGFKEQADAAAAGQFTFGPVEFAQGFLSAQTRSEVRQGDFNQEYISAIRASGDYSETEIDVALEVSRRKALGDPDPIISVYTDKYFGNQEVGRIVRDIMYNRGDIRVQDLLRQIDSAHLGNSGQVMFGAADETAVYDPARASAARQDLANITGFTASVVLDPTIFGSKALRLLQASKFAVAQLAPNAMKGGSVASVIKQARFGVGPVRVNNPVYRFFDNFTTELNRLDDLKSRAAAATDASERSLLESQAASLRQRIARQYADMPDDLIDDFYTTMPRNADGKFDVDTAVQYIDETNAAYVTELGQVTDEVVAMGLAVDEIPRMVEKILNERDLYGKTFAGRVTATNMRRTPLAPRMSLVGALRRRAVNRLIANNMPQKKAVALVSKFVDDMTDPQAVAAGLSDNAVDIGTAAREYKRGAGLLDSGSRLFSSIVTKGTVSLTSGADATQVYRYARMFFPKRTSELLANAFRDGNIGSRRLLMSGLIRSAAASRGIVMTQKQADEWVRKLLPGANDLGTGTRAGERYGLTVNSDGIPSLRLNRAQPRTAVPVDRYTPGTWPRDKDANTPIAGQVIDAQELPDTVYHVTTRASDIRNSGVLRMSAGSDEVSGLGGAPSSAVSFTVSREVAEGLRDDMRFYAGIKEMDTADEVVDAFTNEAVRAGFDQDNLETFLQSIRVEFPRVADGELSVGGFVDYAASQFWSQRATLGLGRNPIIFGGVWKADSPWWKVDPLDIDIIPVSRDEIISAKAAVSDFDRRPPGHPGHGWGLEEVRVYGDVVLNDNNEAIAKPISLSADRNGIEHALHLDQTSDNIALPSIREFEDLRGEIEFGRIPVGRYRNIVGTGFQKATDYWSIGTLFGFRFSIRNAIEEVGLYWLTGGTTRDYFKGRQMSQALRNAKPRVYVRMVEDKATGKRAPAYRGETPELIYRSSLGMFANKREWLKRQFANSKSGKKVDDYFTEWQQHNGYRHWLADLILPSVRRDDSYMALQDLAKGDPEAFQRLAVKSLAAQKIGKVLLDDDDLRAFEFLAGSVHGNALIDEIAEASRYLNDGGFPRFLEGINGLSDDIPPGVGVGKMGDYKFRLGAYGNVRPVQVDTDLNKTVLGTSFWWRELQRTVDGDGTIGEVALRGIREIDRGIPTSVAEIKARIAQAIREDDTYNYAERLSRITDDASIDEFADAYFENVLAHVQRADGSINGDLVGQFFNESGDFTGWWKKVVDEDGNEVATPVISSKFLQKYGKEERPNAVFGREVDESPYIPFAESLPRLLSVNRAYGWMGAQNARLSREPIFLANYVDQFRQTAQARSDMREALARSLREKEGGAELSDEQMAAIEAISDGIYARQSMDNALNLSLSFMDNPANRSNLAWKSRNISRYYRATEDFYRRLKRTGITSPEAYWKAALIYHLMDDTGFVFSDDNGNKYFAYPGNQILQEVTTNIMAKFMGVEITGFRDVDPFLIGGRVLGLTPSADVNQFAPSLSGPISGVFLGGFFQKFPALQGLRSALLGTYSQQADNMWQEMLDAVVPAGVRRAIALMDPEQRDSMLVQSGVDTLAIMAAEGHLDEVTIITEDGTKRVLAGTSIDPETFKQTEEYKAAQAISAGYFITKSVMSWIVAAYPQSFGNTASDFARSSGIDDMQDANRDIRDIVIDPDFAEMLANHADAANPWAAATSEWFGMKASEVIDGPYASMSTLMPFTMSSYKTAGDAVSQIASVQTSKELVEWLRTEEASDLKKAGFGSVRFFLAPREGEFTWPAWNTIKNVLGIKVLKTEDEQIEELLALNGQATENMIRSEYRERMDAAANSPDRLATIAEEQANELKHNRALNPAWDAVKGSATGVYTEANMRKAFGQMRDMLAYLEEKNGTLTPTQEAIDSAINVYLDYASQKSYIVGQTNEAKFERKRLDGYMQREWQIIRNQDENAAFFIDAVLEGLAYDPVYMNAFGDK